ncbi:MAG: ATP synthase F0 subunit B [Nitrospirota bacterium]|nr:MAG: ATP synthase F0 subunit B [Nitrospirota bacterium]
MLEFEKWFFVLLVNFLILIYVLNILLFKPMLALFKERKNATEGALKNADDLMNRKAQAETDLKRELSGAREKAKALYNSIAEAGITKQKEMMSQAQDEAMKMLEEARGKLKDEVAKAREELMKEAEKYSEEIAEKLIKV